MNVKKYLSLNILFLIPLCIVLFAGADACAESYLYQGGPGCVLRKFANGVWGETNATDLDGQALNVKPYGKYGMQWSTKVNGAWYYADKDCFKSEGLASESAVPTVSPTPSPAPQASQKQSVKRAVVKNRKKYSVELLGSYWLMMSNSSKAQTKDYAIVSSNLNKLSSMIGAKARLTYLLKPEHELNLGFSYTTGSRDGSVVGGATDSSVKEQINDTQISLGYRYLFGWKSIVPFLGAELSYNMLYQKDTIAVSATNGASVGYSGSGIGYGLSAGSYYNLSEKFRLSADVNYSIVSAKIKVKETTDSASFTVGDDGGTLNLTHLGLNVGIGYCF